MLMRNEARRVLKILEYNEYHRRSDVADEIDSEIIYDFTPAPRKLRSFSGWDFAAVDQAIRLTSEKLNELNNEISDSRAMLEAHILKQYLAELIASRDTMLKRHA